MKTLSIITTLIFCLSIISIHTKAQSPHAGIFIHGLYASPVDKSSTKFYNGGGGGEAGVLIGRKNTMLVGTIGYSRFFADNDENIYGDQTYIPLKAGIRQYIPLTLHFLFVQGDLGIGFINNEEPGNDGTRFAADIGFGAKLGMFEAAIMWDNFHEVQPEGWASWFTVKAGINLGF